MKILHALVGYLAVIFHTFAFASPLAIDYDGYVNTTQNNIDGALMEYFLGTVVETCQTVTTPNHGDSALMKRVPSDIIEARQEELIPVALAVIVIVVAIAGGLKWIDGDDPKRAAFTQSTISNTTATYPNFNWVICHSPYSIAFDGVEGTDYDYSHHELPISFGRTIGYDLYWAKSGTFYRNGDGGFINWAYAGDVVGTDDGGSIIHFGTL